MSTLTDKFETLEYKTLEEKHNLIYMWIKQGELKKEEYKKLIKIYPL